MLHGDLESYALSMSELQDEETSSQISAWMRHPRVHGAPWELHVSRSKLPMFGPFHGLQFLTHSRITKSSVLTIGGPSFPKQCLCRVDTLPSEPGIPPEHRAWVPTAEEGPSLMRRTQTGTRRWTPLSASLKHENTRRRKGMEGVPSRFQFSSDFINQIAQSQRRWKPGHARGKRAAAP